MGKEYPFASVKKKRTKSQTEQPSACMVKKGFFHFSQASKPQDKVNSFVVYPGPPNLQTINAPLLVRGECLLAFASTWSKEILDVCVQK